MDLKQKPSKLIVEILTTGKVNKFEFDSVVKSRKFQQRMSAVVSRMMSTKLYSEYWSYLDNLRVMRDGKVVYIGPPKDMPDLYGKVKHTVMED